MEMPDRKYLALNGYRYGFNGKENDNEVKGEGNQQDYGMRIYDPRLGRFLSVDPLADDYPELSPYQFGGNTPVQATDLDGLEPAYHYTDSKFGVVMMPAGDNLQRAVPPEHQKFLPQAPPAGKEGMQALSTTLDFIPVVGTVKGAIEGTVGYDMAGNKLSGTDRALGLIPYLKVAKNAKTVLKVEKQLNNAAKAEKAIVKTEKAVESTEKALVKKGNNVSNATKYRVKPRKETLRKVEENQPRNSAGDMIDPNTKEPLQPGQIDLGHKPGQEWRRRKEMHKKKGSTREEVIEAENNPNLYQLEDRSSNRSHKFEKKKGL